MSQFQLFDSVKLKEEIPVDDVTRAYIVELFGQWVPLADNGEFVSSTSDVPLPLPEKYKVEQSHRQI